MKVPKMVNFKLPKLVKLLLTLLYMDLCNIYRKYDFINGLLLGIILGNRLNKTHNNEFLNMCYNQVKDSI